jgi:enoyl-CoA hydratase/carnithine racemase
VTNPATEILLSETDENGILRLTLNDVKCRNALSKAMLIRLGAAFAKAATNPAVRVVVLAANGPAFCAGHDLKEMTAGRDGPDLSLSWKR